VPLALATENDNLFHLKIQAQKQMFYSGTGAEGFEL
jgi:hypothetical protein